MPTWRPLPRLSTRRLTLFLALLSLSALLVITTLSWAVPQSPSLFDYDAAGSVPAAARYPPASDAKDRVAPLGKPAHAPPRQRNDEYGGSSWWTDENWLGAPFSGALTADERQLLPPLAERPAIYCYYDNTTDGEAGERDAEADLLLTWRRAWWAHGFRPVLLGMGDAMRHPRFNEVKSRGLSTGLELDLMRWLAWEAVGGGMLSEYTIFPMCPRNDPLLSSLRHGGYPVLTTWYGLRGALMVGPARDVRSVVDTVLKSAGLSQAESVLSILSMDMVQVDNQPESLAYYGPRTIADNYHAVIEAASQSRVKGLEALSKIINAHLHALWLSNFPRGVEVLKPFPDHTTRMTSDAMDLAHALLACPDTPMSSSCPPNLAKCTPCSHGATPAISVAPHYRSEFGLFTIGVVPHPWTLATLRLLRDTLDMPRIHNESDRDPWVTTSLRLDGAAPPEEKVTSFKGAAAGQGSDFQSLWLTAEDAIPEDLDWHLGFAIPSPPNSPPPLAAPHGQVDDPAEDPTLEWILLERARQVVPQMGDGEDAQVRDALEEWNTADTESWRFTRALQARRAMERIQEP